MTVAIMGPDPLDDAATTDEDATPITIDAVANDTDPTPDLDPSSAVVVTPAVHGSATANGDGTFDYVSDPHYHGIDSFEYSVCDLSGACAEATVVVDVLSVPDSPGARADAFVTDRNAPVSVSAPGVLANDHDYDGDPFTAVLDTGPGSGAVTLNPDGSFTYTPDPGFTGADRFTYTAFDGVLSSIPTAVDITVDSGVVPRGWFLGDSGATADQFDLVATPPTPGDPDPDGDLDPGLTILGSSGTETDSDPLNSHHWILDPGAQALDLNGPVTLKLWSSVAGFELGADVDISAWLYDCDAVTFGSCSPALVAYEKAHISDWNGGTSDFMYREITLGSLTHTVASGRVLALRLMAGHEDLWVAMDSAHPSELKLTLANASPDAVDDSYPVGPAILEDGPIVNLDVLSNDADVDLDPTSLSIEPAPPAAGTVVVKGDNTIDYAPAPDFVGTDTFDYRICDLGGLCEAASVTVIVTPVNDPPSFVKGSDQTVFADSGAQARVGWATSLSEGPADEAGQTLTFNTTGNTNPDLFTSQPQVSSTGTLLFTPALGQSGSATITIELRDDGGVTDGGIDTSAPETFEITVDAHGIVISEFRPAGPGGGDDEFVELFNAGSVAEDLTGWRLHITSGLDFDFYTFPAVTLLPGQHYLVTHPGSPQAGFADDTWAGLIYGTGFGDVQVLTPTGTQVDAFHYGLGPTVGEGTALPPWTNPGGLEGSWERLFGNAYGNCVDSNDNEADFVRNYGKSMLQN
ncbi:MAG: tandem-95 repeat protein, partial [Acidimicrobiia bacterium]|nr:tandem-95 repeat protein [Acidimicrobiia bacterium]